MTPKLRIKGFSGEWEECHVEDIANRYDNLRIPVKASNRQKGSTPYYGANGIQDYVEGYTHDGCFVLVAEDGANDLEHYPVQYVEGKVWVNNHAHVLQAKDKTNSTLFLKYLISETDIKALLVGGGRSKLNADTLMQIVLRKPKIEEQIAISTYFTTLDDMIAGAEKQIASLSQTKAACLQSMFPQEGETIPRVRFKGFEGEWKLCPVSDLLVERREFSPKSDEFPLKAFIAHQGVADKGERYDRSALVTDIENKIYKRTKLCDFIYSSNNLETGSIGMNCYGDATISPVYSVFYATDKSDPYFVNYRMIKRDFINNMIKWRQGVIYGQWRIHEKDFLQINVTVPNIEEQRKIGDYFRSLDQQIDLQKKRLEKLRQIKAACLDNMFV